ncbi:MAG: class II fructose-bisphosphate aldolase [bacterium]|nr:class II fructose-bisphosphate aldolase [bacterium]
MKTFKDIIAEADEKQVAVGHFNIADTAALKAVFESARELNVPVIIGTSEGEREFLDPHEAVALIKELRKKYDYPIFINADHTHSLEKVEEAAKAGYDAILFDGGKLPLEENFQKTKEAVDLVRSIDSNIIVEGELGYIGGGSKILKEIPEGAAIKAGDFTNPEDAARFVVETGIDLLAPAVGNIHGILASAANPNLDIERIREIRSAGGAPLVLHGGSGVSDEDFSKAIEAGVAIIHISTEMRVAWRAGLEKSLKEKPDELAPYKLLDSSVLAIKEVVSKRLRLFNRMK